MNKKLKVILIVAASVILTAILYIVFIHPRLVLFGQTMLVYDAMSGTTDIGEPIMDYEKYDVTDDTLKMVDYGDFSVGVPSDWVKQERESDVFIIYVSEEVSDGSDGSEMREAITSTGTGEDYSDMILLNREIYESDELWRRVNKGFEQLGYGMPTTAYDSFRCALSMDSRDYNLINYNKSLAFTHALPYRAGSFYVYDGVTSWSYHYVGEEKCGFISEAYLDNFDMYRYYFNFYDPEDLNTEYLLLIKVKDRDTAYAVINSVEID
ncbi:MAG: hypothetical protein IJ336_08275 [Lachnospiraceae bacterium]|nr:hypothetical protein [Lachnospiraceae bacterium]